MRRTSNRSVLENLPGSTGYSHSDFPFYWLAQAHLTYTQALEPIVKRLGASIAARRVLLMLHQYGTLSISDLATHAVTKTPTMVRIVYRMRSEGWIHTETNAEDARFTDVSITRRGEQLLQRINQESEPLFRKAYRGLSESQLALLNTALARLHANLSE